MSKKKPQRSPKNRVSRLIQDALDSAATKKEAEAERKAKEKREYDRLEREWASGYYGNYHSSRSWYDVLTVGELRDFDDDELFKQALEYNYFNQATDARLCLDILADRVTKTHNKKNGIET